jgi:hypothetical protein
VSPTSPNIQTVSASTGAITNACRSEAGSLRALKRELKAIK